MRKTKEAEQGPCPFYKYKPLETSERLGCQITGEHISVLDSDSLVKVATLIEDDCIGLKYLNCPHYKKGMKKLAKKT